MIELSFFVLIVSALIDRDSLNRIFDFLVPVYGVFAIIAIVSFIKSKNSSETTERVYVYQNPNNTKDIPWKEQFCGTFTTNSNEKLKEYFLLNGAPSFLAGGVANMGGKVTITSRNDNTQFRFEATGSPKGTVEWTDLAESEDAAVEVERTINGTKFMVKLWADEEKKAICMNNVEVVKQTVHRNQRILTEDGNFVQLMSASKPSGESVEGVKVFYTRVK